MVKYSLCGVVWKTSDKRKKEKKNLPNNLETTAGAGEHQWSNTVGAK